MFEPHFTWFIYRLAPLQNGVYCPSESFTVGYHANSKQTHKIRIYKMELKQMLHFFLHLELTFLEVTLHKPATGGTTSVKQTVLTEHYAKTLKYTDKFGRYFFLCVCW